MLVLPWFAFIHVHKTGGSFVRKLLRDEYGDAIVHETNVAHQAGHERYDDLPDGYHAPVLAFVRNPWDWYVSWYHFVIERLEVSGPNVPFYDAVFAGGQNDFATAVQVLCAGRPPHPMPSVLDTLNDGHDFYTAVVKGMLGDGLNNPRLTIGRFEDLREQLGAFVASTEAPRKERLAAAARSAPPEMQGKHGAYRDYYDLSLRDLVAEKASWMINRFGYAF